MAEATDTSKKEQERGTAPKMKDGVILGPDGKPCRVCSSVKAWSSFRTQHKKDIKQTIATSDSNDTTITKNSRDECPVDVERLGRHTWTFLHTTAAYYPEKPSSSQRSAMSSLFNALPTLYPCSHCADELGSEIKRNPPDLSNGHTLSQWLCSVHNEVNRRLGKVEFDCNLVDQRWKDGWQDGRCD